MYRVPGEELNDLPPLSGLHTHSFRWDHAIPFARWALGDACPTDITVFLIEAAAMEMGADLSEPVERAMEQVIELVERDFLGPLRPRTPDEVTVEITAEGYLRMDRCSGRQSLPSDALAAVPRDGELCCSRCSAPVAGDCCLSSATRPGIARRWSGKCCRTVFLAARVRHPGTMSTKLFGYRCNRDSYD